MKSRQLMLPVFWLALAGPALASEPVLSLLYYEQPPLTHTDSNGKAAGQFITPLHDILKSAGITPHFEPTPAQRIFAELKANRRPFCAPGWYWSVERAEFAKFSAPYQLDEPLHFFASKEIASQLKALGSLDALLKNPDYALVQTQNFTAGPMLAARLQRQNTPVNLQRVPDREALFSRLKSGHADYTLMRESVWRYEKARHPELADQFILFDYAQTPDRIKLYLMCSRQLDDALLERLNRAIARHAPELQPGR